MGLISTTRRTIHAAISAARVAVSESSPRHSPAPVPAVVQAGGRRRQPRETVRDFAMTRVPTATDRLAIESGSGWPGAKQGLPGSDTNAEMRPYRLRGLWPTPGYTEQMLRADPAVYSGFERQLLTVASLNWDIIPPPEATADELAQCDVIRRMWSNLPYGFVGHAVIRPFTARIHGFSVSEKTLDVDPDTGWWVLSGLHWIAPWSVKAWILDADTGYALGILERDESGERPIWWDSLMYTGQMYWGRNYEGVGVLRPLKYYWDHKTQIIVDDATARERASAGIPYGEAPVGVNEETYASDFASIQTILDNLLYSNPDEPASYISPNGWKVGINYLDGGMPDSTPMLQYLDHQIAQQMTDTLSQLGVSEHGARAVGAEQRLEKWSMLGGLCALAAHNIDQSIHRHIYEMNGWDTARMCRTIASGANDVEMYRRIFEFLTQPIADNPIIEVTDEMREQIKRSLGLRG